MTREISVAVIGLGPRGLGVLERIVTLARKAGPAAGAIRVEVIDPRCDGAGVHAIEAPDYLLLNTTAGQVTMFPDPATVGADVDEPGPTLHEWVTDRGLRLAADGFTVGTTGRPIRPSDFLPRRVLGEYLGWFLDHVRGRLPDHVRLTLHRASAMDLTPGPGRSLITTLSDDTQVRTGYAFLTTGYTPNASTGSGVDGDERIIAEPYPLPDQMASVKAGQIVAIDGFGLAAMDLMSSLTVGRGGRFVDRDGQLAYLPSGDEPTMLFYSRSGLPCRARPLVVELGPKYQPLAFTTDAIDRLRAERERAGQGRQLDFNRDLMPLILAEMRIAYRRCQVRTSGPEAEAGLVAELTAAAGNLAGLIALLDERDDRLGPFDARALFDGSADILLDDSASYQKWLADVISRDLAEGVLGFIRSPIKAALDILRDQRDMFRYAVDFNGLTSESVDAFNRHTVPALNRAVVGPQYERHSEILTLMAAGLAAAPFGPAPSVAWHEPSGRWTITSTQLATPFEQQADWLAAGHLSLPAVANSGSPLLRALHRDGWIRPYRPEGGPTPGIDIDADQHPINTDGQPDRRLWVLGPLCEGATFYNNLVPSPNAYSRPMFDAHRCVMAMFAEAREH